ncbi:MAG: molecular chaperone DnaJ [Candidatus Uhrbacteria bacterium]|nr:molecular chaperone DnaJ [Candidatus Uhrbacteria bacterium]
MARDYYDILGVPKGANQDEIKKAFRKKAHELHPDKGGDAAAFKEVNEAYQVLGDAKKRSTYDQFGHAAFQGGAGSGGPGGFGGFDMNGMNINFDDLGDLGDVLGNMFGFGGGRSSGSRSSRGADKEIAVTLSFLESFTGVTKQVSLRMHVACAACSGSGAEPGSKIATCSTCHGQGRVMRVQQTPFGAFQTAATCSACHGQGKMPEKACKACGGEGKKVEEKTISFSIPAGISDGETLKISGSGEAGSHGTPAGDLYVHIRVSKDSRFVREGNDVMSEVFIPYSTCALGGSATIDVVGGSADLVIPSGTQSGTVLKMKGKGFPFLHGHGRGDHHVTVYPDVPVRPSKDQKKALEELKGLGL